jgi:hypothetical protein
MRKFSFIIGRFSPGVQSTTVAQCWLKPVPCSVSTCSVSTCSVDACSVEACSVETRAFVNCTKGNSAQ